MNYAKIYFNEIPPFISEALDTPALRRLQGVGMNCGCEYTSFPRFADIDGYSRYDHSLGTALIVWRFTRDRTQAMAGLLHDISTPVFAHVVDFLKGDHMTQESTEADTEEFIKASPELTAVLGRNGLSIDAVKNYHIYPIADNDSPKLSADRLEYTVGNMINYGFADYRTAKELFENITVGINEYGETELMFSGRQKALKFAENALKCSEVYVSDEDRYSMQLLAEILKHAIEHVVIGYDDLITTEPQIIEKLLSDKSTATIWCNYVNLCAMETAAEKPDGGEWRKIRAKKRCIDPYVQNEGRLSQLDGGFCDKLNAFRSKSQDYWVKGVT